MEYPQPVEKPIVHTLLGHRDATMGVQCLGSLRRSLNEPIRFCIHDDGTLENEDKRVLADELRDVQWFSRLEADLAMESALKKYPRCREFRNRQIYGLKLFDVPLLSRASKVIFCDSDIFFFRRCSGLFSLPHGVDCIFMRDIQDAYSVRPWDIVPFGRFELPRALNCGLFVIKKEMYSLDGLEEFFSQTTTPSLSLWLEQTAWGWLAGRKTGSLWDERYVKVIQSKKCFQRDIVAGHFVRPVRNFLATIEKGRNGRLPGPGFSVPLVPMERLSAHQLFLDQVRRFLRTRVFPV